MSVLLRLMDVPSDDFFAEMLTKQLGVRFGTGGSTAAGAQVISSVARHATASIRGSSTAPGCPALTAPPRGQVVELLDAINGTPIGTRADAALPTVGVNGTVRTIALHTAAQGRCIAKTGTLDNVTNLAGYCHSAARKLLAFALFIDGPSNWRGAPADQPNGCRDRPALRDNRLRGRRVD